MLLLIPSLSSVDIRRVCHTNHNSPRVIINCGADLREEHPKNDFSPISVDPSSVSGLIVVREQHLKKALASIFSRDGGSSTFTKFLQSLNVAFSIVFNKGGSLNVIREAHW